MKALIDQLTNTIHGIYQEPLNFDISGHYVIDIPQLISGVIPGTDDSVSDLIGAKNKQWATFSGVVGETIFDELITNPNVDPVNSTGIAIAANKRTLILPGGTLLTNPISVTSGTYAVFLHYAGFVLYRALVNLANPTSPTQGPSQMLYSYNPDSTGFENFQNSTFTVTVCQATSPFTNVATPTPDSTTAATSLPSTFRLKFFNNSIVPYHLSDWILIYGST